MIDHAFTIVVCCGVALLAMALPAVTEERPLRGVALVIGNADYEHLAPLANPGNDARAIEDMLDDLGFETDRTTDADASRLARDLGRFLEDAEDADVAVLYYAGHGIEAGGENYLVPVDADLSALEAAGERLVPVSQYLDRLKASVPVTILILDACRDNPFPAGSTVRFDAAGDPAPMGESGLVAARGGAALSAAVDETYGAVIAFAAEPGKAALDGAPGENSPYTTAVLRHLDAMQGEEFGTVMRMVAEEVYLKTAGRQRPWVNESLRRLLYFGGAPDPVAGEEGEILAERRQLLLTIASLPDIERRRVEAAAAEGGVPMDALYGLLAALGQHTPNDPAELDAILRSQTEHLKQIIADRAVLVSADAEIARLSALAEQAIGEGALATAIRLHERAKSRVAELEGSVRDAAASARDRLIEFSAVLARSADTYVLAFDHLRAAEDYARAHDLVAEWDWPLAFGYRLRQGQVLTEHGAHFADAGALRQAIAALEAALDVAVRHLGPHQQALAHNNLGIALAAVGKLEPGTQGLLAAAAAYRAAEANWSRELDPLNWATLQLNLSSTHFNLGLRESGTESFEAAVRAARLALLEATEENDPEGWSKAQNNLANALAMIVFRTGETGGVDEAIAAFEAASRGFARDRHPLIWATIRNNLGSAYQVKARTEIGAASLELAITAFREALQERRREIVPVPWAGTTYNLGIALRTLGDRIDSVDLIEQSVDLLRAALEFRSRGNAPLLWADTQIALGNTLRLLGTRGADPARLEGAIEAYRLALLEATRERAPAAWAGAMSGIGDALRIIGDVRGDEALIAQAASTLEAAIEDLDGHSARISRANAHAYLADAYRSLGVIGGDRSMLVRARDAARSAFEDLEGVNPHDLNRAQAALGRALLALGRADGSHEAVREAYEHLSAVEAFHRASGNRSGWIEAAAAVEQARNQLAAMP
ncbi:MAG: caspase family protein [Rhizobiaceae bacterium]